MHGAPHPLPRATATAAALAMTMVSATDLMAAPPPYDYSDHDNPISRVARLISPKLVQIEDRVAWLDRELLSLARYQQFPLSYSLGYRGHRPSDDSPDPTITLDLGEELAVEGIYLIPTQREYLNDSGIFPRRFTLEIASAQDFSDARIVFSTGKEAFSPMDGIPFACHTEGKGRYVRLSVQQGHNKGATDLFGLSEFFVFSGGLPVSFHAKVSTSGDLNVDNIWHPEALVDGRTPLGTWHNGESIRDHFGDAVIAQEADPGTAWRITLPQESVIDQVVLFPYQVRQSNDISIFPQSLQIEVTTKEDPQPRVVHAWSNPLPGTSHRTPLVLPLDHVSASSVTIRTAQPWEMGHRRMNALSEIQVWSGGRNIVAGRETTRFNRGQAVPIAALTDGFTSERKISPIQVWLEQLIRRGAIERELAVLRDIHTQLASRSELNVSWGSAVILGLTFLIPVFVFERRRMQSKEQLDVVRKRIASDLHDDIGSNLGSISLIARTARKDLARLHGPSELDHDLGEVEMIARESSLAMRDIVWLLERKQDSIGDLVHRMRETAGRLLREIDFTLECNSTKTAAKLTLDAKRHLFLFYKESIHNVVKHSQARRVSIRLWDEGEQLGLEIVDDGIGLPVNRDRIAISVKKLEDRADVMGGILQITSTAETGTCIRLLVRRSRLTTRQKAS